MPLTPETLPRHELVDLDCEVVAASNPDAIGISGTVVMETTRMLAIEGADRVWHVPKADATFAFTLPSGESEARSASTTVSSAERSSAEQSSGRGPRDSGDEPRTRVRVEGERLVSRPARRTANTGDSQWR